MLARKNKKRYNFVISLMNEGHSQQATSSRKKEKRYEERTKSRKCLFCQINHISKKKCQSERKKKLEYEELKKQ